MIEPSHPLIEAATKHMAHNAELHLAGQNLLNETLDPSHPNIPLTIEKLEKLDSKKHNPLIKWLLPSLAAIAAFSIFYIGSLTSFFIYKTYRYAKTFIGEPPTPKYAKHLSAEDILLLGDPRLSRFQQKEALLASAPDRPDYYSDYITAYISEHRGLPHDYFDTVARIDPDNSYFLYIAAGIIGEKAVKALPQTTQEKASMEPRKYEILDQKALTDSIDILHKAAKLPRFDSYERSLTISRMRLFSNTSYLELIKNWSYLASITTSIIHTRRLADMIAAQATLYADQQDKENLMKLNHSNEAFLRHCLNAPIYTLVEELVYRVNSTISTKSLYAAFQKVGIREIEQLEIRHQKIEEDEKLKKFRKISKEELDIKHSGFIQTLTLPTVGEKLNNPIYLTKEDLAPGRNVESDLASQILVLTAIKIVFLSIISVALFRFRTPTHARLIADRIGKLFTIRDWLWIIGPGIVLPFFFIFLISRHTPLGGHEYGMAYFNFAFPLLHYSLITAAVIATPILIIRWRIKPILSPFGLQSHKPPYGWILLTLGIIVTLITYPILKAFPDNKAVHLIRLFPVLWLIAIFATACRAFFGKKEYRISRAICANALIPSYSIAILLLAALYPLLIYSERQNIAQDKITAPDPNYPGFSPYEYKVSQQIRIETKQMLNME